MSGVGIEPGESWSTTNTLLLSPPKTAKVRYYEAYSF